MDALGLFMTIAGIVLSVVALALSILFYRWADRQAKDSERTLTELRAATEGLQHLVSGIRDESFSLLRTAYSDMGELAKLGVRRDQSSQVVLTASAEPSSPATDVPRANSSKPPRPRVTTEISEDDLRRISLELGSHMMKRRGASFPEALQEAQRLIEEALDEVPDGTVLTTGDFAQKLTPLGYDVAEVAYALAVMAESGKLRRDKKA